MSKVVFVGNVPYNMGEDQLIDVFKSVGQVIGFRLVFDRETGKPKGYGFCEFADHETAQSAVRNLNNTDVGGRPLRIDLADSDPFLEGKTTIHGEIIDGGGETRAQWRERREREDGKSEPTGILDSLPPGIPVAPGMTSMDAITQIIATTPPSTMFEVLAQMKAFVINHPEQAKILLQAHPQLAQALFQALITTNIVESKVLEKMRDSAVPSTAAANQGQPMNMVPPPVMGQQFPPFPPAPPVQANYPPVPPAPTSQPPYFQTSTQSAPTASVPQQPTLPPATPSGLPPALKAQLDAIPNLDAKTRGMLENVLSLTPEQVAQLPPNEQEAVAQMKLQFGVTT